MAAFQFRRRQTRRWWYAGATLMAVAFFTVFFVGGAFGVSGSPSNFESQDALNNANPPVPDGNMTVDTTDNSDWNCFANGGATDTSGFVKSGITVGTNGATCTTGLVKANALAKSDPAATTSDDSWVNGTKFDNSCEPVGTNKNPAKDDFTAIASYNETKSSDNHTFLYGATIRYTANGSASENLELNQVKGTSACPITRTAGDHLLAFDYNSGGKVLNLHVLTWIDSTHQTLGGNNGTCIIKTDSMPCWGANVITPSLASFDGDTNASAITAAKNGINGQALVAGQFAEFGVDLTSALSQDPKACNTTSQIDWESRASGSSFSSNPEDIAITTHPISNCGQVIIRKVTVPSPDPNSTNFNFGDNIASATDTFQLANGGSEDFGSSVLQGSYSVTETADPGYTLSSINCSASTETNGSTASGVTSTGVTSISLKAGDVIDCTYTNTLHTATMGTQVSNAGPVTPGAAVHDTATVTGSGSTTNPSGTVTFSMCGPTTSAAGCSSGGTSVSSAGNLSGSAGTGIASAQTVDVNTSTNPLAPGYYCFRASWPGDTTYPRTTNLVEYGGSSGTSECFQVSQIGTTVVTTPSVSSTTFGNTGLTDSALITAASEGGGAITGTVTFHLCDPTQLTLGVCSTGGHAAGSTTTLTPGTPPPTSATAVSPAYSAGVSMTGTWCWRADYTPATGSNYTGNSDSSSGECFLVTDSTSASSTQSWVPNDTATVTSTHGAPLNGTLTVQLYTGTGCVAANIVSDHVYTKTLTTNTTGSISLTTTNATVYNSDVSWKVTFVGGDSNVSDPTARCESSSLTVNN